MRNLKKKHMKKTNISIVKRITLILIGFLNNIAVSGHDFGDTGIEYAHSDWHEVPGVERIEDHHHIGKLEHTEFDFPDKKDEMKCLYQGKRTVYMTESYFIEKFIDISSTAFVATHRLWHDYNKGMDYPKDLFVIYNLEWTTINKTSTWSNAVYYGCTTQPEDEHVPKTNKNYGYNYLIPGKVFSLNTNKLWEEIKRNADNLYYYNKYGYIDIFLRNVYYCKWNYTDEKGWIHEDKTFLGYAHTSGENVLQIRIFKCGVGDLSVNSSCNPQLEDNLYAIYENQRKETIELSSTVDKVLSNVVKCTVNDSVKITNPTGSSHETQISNVELSKNNIYTNNISVGTFKESNNNQEIKAGQKFEVHRTIKYEDDLFVGSKECESNAIEFLVLPSPTLDGIYEVPNKTECPVTTQLVVGQEASMFENDYKIYPGNKCDFGEFSKYESAYGVKYRWKYSTDKTSERFLETKGKEDKIRRSNELFTYNPDNTPDLRIPLSSLEEGVTYKFRQCVILENFENTEIYAPDDVYYTIKISKKVKEEDLQIEVSQPEVCMGDNLEDVQFTAKYKEGENPSDYKMEKFSFNCKIINGDDVEEFTSDNEVNTTRNYPNIQNDVRFVVSMQDGCSSEPIVKEAVMHVNPLPTFTVDNITTTSNNISLTKNTSSEENYIVVKGYRGRECKLIISDKENSTHKYFYSEKNDGSDLKPMTGGVYKTNLTDDMPPALYFYKKRTVGTNCISEPVKVEFMKLDEVAGNRFLVSTIYVCPGSTVPKLNENNAIPEAVTGQATAIYEWQYSNDGSSWYKMSNVNAEGESIYFENKNYDGSWQRKINEEEKVYLRRVVTSYMPDGTELGKDVSDALTVTTYSKPKPSVTVDGLLTADSKCYGDTIELSMRLNNDHLLDEQALMTSKFDASQCLTKYWYFHFDGEKHKALRTSTKMDAYKMPATQNYMVQSAVEFCGDTIFSGQSIDVETYEKIDVTPTVSTCRVVGNEITIRAAKDGHLCEIHRGSEKFAGVEGVSTAKIKLTEKKDYNYDIIVLNTETGCQTTLHKTIKESEIKERKKSLNIGPNGDPNQTIVCAGTLIPLSCKVKDDEYTSYSWSVNGDIKTGETGESMEFSFPEAGKSYKVKRTCFYYEGTDLCYTVTDSITMNTYGALTTPAMGYDGDRFCYGENLEVQGIAKGGGSGTTYDLALYPGNVTQEDKHVSIDGSVFFNVKLTNDTTFYVVVTDNKCTNTNIYRAESRVGQVKVEKDLSFDIIVTNNIITPEDFKNGKTNVSVNLKGVDKGDVVSPFLSASSGDFTFLDDVTYNGTAMSVSIDSFLFEESSRVDLEVYRKGTISTNCKSEAVYSFILNTGFSGTPIIETSNGQKDTAEVCGGETVELSVKNTERITFGDESILNMKDAKWQWYYGNSPVGDGVTYKFTAEAGKKYSYTVVFSGKDEGGRTRKISSNPIIVKGGSGMKVGGISFVDMNDNEYYYNFYEFCKGSKEKVMMSCKLDPNNVALKWEYSNEGNNWEPVPAEWNGNNSTAAKSITVEVDYLGNKKTFFRVVATDDCGTNSQSDNYLSVNFKEVEKPQVSYAGSSVFLDEQSLPESLLFNRNYYHTDPYDFIGVRESGLTNHSNQFVDYIPHFGENTVKVVRREKAKISDEICISDTVDYTFNIYKRLVTPSLTKNPLDSAFCPNETRARYLHLDQISGGDSATYKTSWQYKLENGESWYAVKEGDNMELFTANIGQIEKNFDEYGQTVKITNLVQTVSFRAIVSCGGGYSGGYATSNEVTMNVYAPLKDNGIDYGTKTICYNSAIDTIKGYVAKGGSGKYTYTWEWSNDTVFSAIVKGEDNDPFFAPTNEGGKYNLKTTTYFRRKVTDDVCKNTLYSNVKKVVVRDSFNIHPEDVQCDKIVSTGSRAELTGITDFSQSGTHDIQYIWWETENKELARSEVSKSVLTEPLDVPSGDESFLKTYYVQSVKGGCPSANKMPIDIYVYNQTGGHIYIEDHDPEKGNYWICSGTKDIQIASDDYAPNATFTWFFLNKNATSPTMIKRKVDGGTSVNVTTPEVRLDTTNATLSLINRSGYRQAVQIYRRTSVMAGGKENFLYSDTVTIYVVPTLESVSNALYADGLTNPGGLAGDITVKGGKKNYCLGDTPNMILGYLETPVDTFWTKYKDYIGPWLYNKSYPGGFKTYYEYQKNNGEWVKDTEYDYSNNQFAGSAPYYVEADGHEMSGTYRVRRVMDDGCTTLASNELVLSLFDQKLDPDTVETYAFTPEMTSFRRNDGIVSGYEIGDSIFFSSKERNADLIWYLDPECTEVLANGSTFCSMRLTSEIAEQKAGEGAYIYVKARREECIGEAVAIPFEYGTESNGGTIYISDSIICHNGIYSDIINETPASGTYVAPVYGQMKWTYTWQYKRSRDSRTEWSKIEGETGTGLSADIINEISSITITDSTPLLIRRVATNDKGRVRYSNVLALTHYKRLAPGTISLNGTKDKFCAYDTLPYVKKDLPASGGKVYGAYNVTWQYNINGGEWETAYAIDSLYVGWLTDSLDRTVNNTINVRCKYADECEEVTSEPVQVTLYRTNGIPSIYQNSDSCNAEEVRLTIYKDEHEKTYHWYAISVLFSVDSTSITEEKYWHREGDENIIRRFSSMPADYYGVQSEDKETGCFSDFYYFYVDSLPKLDQSAPIAPIAICPNSDLEIKGGTLSGGNGEKSFQWQISLTGKDEDFSDIVDGTMEDLQLSSRFIKTASYFRRIVTDMCDADTSDIVLVNIRSKANVSPEDLSFDDFKCPLGIFSAKVVAEMDSIASSEYWTLGDDTISVIGKSIQMEGFEGDSMSYPFTHFVTDSTGLTCPSEVIYVTAHNKPAIVENTNIITTENYKPCIESTIRIDGSVLGGLYPEQIKYTWYVNGNEQVGEFGANLRTTADASMSIFRVADNGCVKDTSNTLKLEGQHVYSFDYSKELSMTVESNVSDSSVVLNIQGSRNFDESYYFSGDGEMPAVSSNNILLPYKYDVYKDSILKIYAKQSYCVEPFVLNPFKGGVISIDGDTVLCGGSKISPIVATELEGGLDYAGPISYQWQYKNERTADFINIDNATGKYYTPSVIDIPTTYRRLAYSKTMLYMSKSNELTITIKSLVTMTGITTNYSDSELDDFGLDHSQTSVLKTASLPMYLQDSVFNADRVLWQKSHDLNEWNTVETMERNSTNLYEMRISDTALIVYYRVIGENDCGADTSKVFTVKTDIAPLITDDELVLLDTICDGDKFTRIAYKNPRSDVYRYSYSLSTQNFISLYAVKSSVSNDQLIGKGSVIENDESLIEDGLAIFYPRESFDVTITRHVIATGATSKKVVHFVVDHFSSSFKYIVDGASEYPMGNTENSVRLNQGSKVSFIAEATSDVKNSSDISYKWHLIEPLNLNYYSTFGGSVGIEGLTSKSQSPSCYFYNAGTYKIVLEVTDGICKSTMSDSALYIDKSTVRSYKVAAAFADEDDVLENEAVAGPLYVDVTPTLVKTSFEVYTNTEEGLPYEVIDEVGLKVKEGILLKTERIDATAWRSGVYIVNVNGMIFKVIKM